MTTRNALLSFALLALIFGASVSAGAAGAVHSFRVDGLACPFCSYGVEKQLRSIPGVRRVEISVKTGMVTVTMKDGAKLTRAQADRAVRSAGFTMRNFR